MESQPVTLDSPQLTKIDNFIYKDQTSDFFVNNGRWSCDNRGVDTFVHEKQSGDTWPTTTNEIQITLMKLELVTSKSITSSMRSNHASLYYNNK